MEKYFADQRSMHIVCFSGSGIRGQSSTCNTDSDRSADSYTEAYINSAKTSRKKWMGKIKQEQKALLQKW